MGILVREQNVISVEKGDISLGIVALGYQMMKKKYTIQARPNMQANMRSRSGTSRGAISSIDCP